MKSDRSCFLCSVLVEINQKITFVLGKSARIPQNFSSSMKVHSSSSMSAMLVFPPTRYTVSLRTCAVQEMCTVSYGSSLYNPSLGQSVLLETRTNGWKKLSLLPNRFSKKGQS